MPTTRVLSLGVAALALMHAPGCARAADPGGRFDLAHAAFTRVLQRHVSDGLVDYGALGADRELGGYLAALSTIRAEELDASPVPDRIAFWINAYNPFTLKLVLDHPGIRSIRSIGLFPGSAFRRKFIHLAAVGTGPVSLDFIEHDTLRGHFREPRVHFALVCASRSCPPLRGEAYRGADLHRQQRERGSVVAFVVAHAPAALAEALRSGPVRVAYEPYDWSLNGR